MVNELSKRFLEVLDYLIKEKIVADNKDFAASILVSSSMITEISKGRSNVGLTAIQNAVLKFPINPDWLLTGRGSMLCEDQAQQPYKPISAPSDMVVLRLMDKLDQKDAENKQLQSDLRSTSEELAALKVQLSQYEVSPPVLSHKEKNKDLGDAKDVSTRKRSSPNVDSATSANVP